MSYGTGTATNIDDLYAKIIEFVTTDATLVAASQNWAVMWQGAASTDGVVLKGPGISTVEEIYVGFKRSGLCFALRGYMGYVDGGEFSQPLACKYVYTPYWDDTMDYWIFANGQRIIVTARVNTTYQHFYIGKFNPYAPPTQYTMPMLISGEYGAEISYTSPSVGFLCFTDFYNTWARGPSNTWCPVDGDGSRVAAMSMNMWPTWDGERLSGKFYNHTTLADGTYVLYPYILVADVGADMQGVFGEIDGIYCLPYPDMTDESIISVDGVDYIVFHDGTNLYTSRTFAIRMD